MTRLIVPLLIVAAAFSTVFFVASGSEASVNVDAQQDAFNNPDGWPGYDDSSSRIFIGKSRHQDVVGGWLFDGLAIPACSIVTEAHVTLVQRNWGHVFQTTFAMEDVPSPSSFSKSYPPSERWPNRTGATSTWTWDKGSPDDEIQSPSLAAMVQELLDSYGSIDSLVLLESPDPDTPNSSYHEWWSVEGGEPARISIEYVSGGGSGYGYGYGYGNGYGYGCTPPPPDEPGMVWESVDSSEDDAYHDPLGWPNYSESDGRILAGAPGVNGPVYGGWRWDDLDIPSNAIITSAYAELTQKQWGYEIETTLAFEDHAAPVSFSNNYTPADRWADRTDFDVEWFWDKDTPGTVVRTSDLTAGIQELVTRYGGLDAVVLIESGEGVQKGRYHEWIAFDRDPDMAARIHVEWRVSDGEPTPEPESGTVAERVDSGGDDAYHDPLGWPYYRDSDVRILAGMPGKNGPVYGGLRWDDLAIPHDATITSAYVELTQQHWGWEIETTLSFDDDGSPGIFSIDDSPFIRWQDRTAFELSWTWPRGNPDDVIRTPDLSAGIQELVDRYGGLDEIVMIEKGDGEARHQYHTWHSFESDPEKAAQLHIEWTR